MAASAGKRKQKLKPENDENFKGFIKKLKKAHESKSLPENAETLLEKFLEDLTSENGASQKTLEDFISNVESEYKGDEVVNKKFLTSLRRDMTDLHHKSFKFHAKHGSEFYVYAYWYKWAEHQVAWMKIKDNFESDDFYTFIKGEGHMMTAWFQDELDELTNKWGKHDSVEDGEDDVNNFIEENNDTEMETGDIVDFPQSLWPLILLTCGNTKME
jgi:hypothetical protein